ncbi:MAG: AraC family transcriptional regulator [Anaerolineae bacterium]
MTAEQEWSRYYSRRDVYNVEFLHARFQQHAFSRHVHDYYVVGMIEDGYQTFSYRREKHRTAQQGIILLNPDEPHTGEPATPDGWFAYKALYPTLDFIQMAAAEVGSSEAQYPYFPQPVIYDSEIAQNLRALHQSLLLSSAPLEAETRLLSVFVKLILRHADLRSELPRVSSARTPIQRVREYIDAHYDQPINLTTLAQVAALTPYHLVRTFTAEIGIPPHSYLESVRIRQAQRLILAGEPLVEVALATGFAHQSHFNNRFRRLVGVTPGQYQRRAQPKPQQ